MRGVRKVKRVRTEWRGKSQREWSGGLEQVDRKKERETKGR